MARYTCLMLTSGKIEEANLSYRNLFCNQNINEFHSLLYQLKRHVQSTLECNLVGIITFCAEVFRDAAWRHCEVAG